MRQKTKLGRSVMASLSREEAKAAARLVSAGWLSLDKRRSEVALPDHIPNIFGSFWPLELVEMQIVNLRRAAEGLLHCDEKAAALYSLASLLHQVFRLVEAEAVCNEISTIKGANHPPVLRLSAEIEARNGNLQRAREIAGELAKNPRARFFCISDTELISLHRIGFGAAP